MIIQKYDIIEVLRELTNSYQITIVVDSHIDNLDGTFTIETKNTYHFNKGMMFTVLGVDYTVTDFVQNESLTYKKSLNSSPSLESDFVINSPIKYLVGTPRLTNQELTLLQYNLKRFPFLWVIENYRLDYSKNGSSLFACEGDFTITLFNDANREEWLNLDHRMNVLNPLKGLLDDWMNYVSKDKRVYNFEDWSIRPLIDYGISESQVLPDQITGLELTINIKLYKTC